MNYCICDMRAEGEAVELFLNGMSLARIGAGSSPREAVPVNHLLVPGINHLAARLGSRLRPDDPDPPLSRVRFGRRTTVDVGLELLPAGAFPGEGEGTDVLRWSRVIERDTEVGMPMVFETTFPCPRPTGSWAWQSSPRLVLDGGLRRRVNTLLSLLIESLRRADAQLFLRLADVRFREVCAAFGEDAAERKERWAAGLRRLSSEPNWLLPEPEEAMMALRLCAGGRLIECLAADWRPIVRARQDERGVFRVTYPLFLAMIDGQLAIVR